ncbi:MAG: hypothetical protein IT291_09400 [Deltaproteobacteria bacterium]|nr:hypothetical protein [Deltaproteobacteria bacterium]
MKRVKLSLLLCFLVLGTVSACTPLHPKPERTQLEIRQMQTREYESVQGGLRQVMKALINTLQDAGFIIQSADKELGFITAQKETDIEDKWNSFFAHLGATQGQPARYTKNSILECSVNVTEFGSNIRVRANFQNKVQDNFGATVLVQQLDNPLFYQEFFSKVDKGIFIERQGL